jgi:UV DNA damage endonuclease
VIDGVKIGYPCINLTIGCRGDRTFRLKSYSEERLIATVDNNLDCLLKMLRFNVKKNILFFRITSDLVPFASHPVCKLDWRVHFEDRFKEAGSFIKANDIRISMHPDQFTLINSLDYGVFKRSLKELLYHAQVLDAMGLDTTAKIQIHVGGAYGDKKKSMQRFIERFHLIPEVIRRRLVVENDDKNYTLKECIGISKETGVSVLFDVFHHQVNNSGESIQQAFSMFHSTWRQKDGVPMVDFSFQGVGKIRGGHPETIDLKLFQDFLDQTKPYDFDIMLEIKDKEQSAIKAVEAARKDERFLISQL